MNAHAPTAAHQHPITDEPLLGFRLAYLRAIARSWRDDKFKRRLLDEGTNDIQPLLVSECGLKTQWKKLHVRLESSADTNQQTRWLPLQTGGWVGRDDRFVIHLPPPPPKNGPSQAEALAAYYQHFPNFMGPAHAVSCDEHHKEAAGLDTGLGIPDGGPGTLLAFGGVVLRALALSWQRPDFREELKATENTDATQVLSQWLGYNSPFNFLLQFKEDTDITWDPEQAQWRHAHNEIVLNYPEAPAEQDKDLRGIALTSYNNTGSAYPFTC